MIKYISRIVWLVTLVLILGGLAFSQQQTYNEAPELNELVSSGGLPPVETRLPESPLIVNPIEEVGEYGGTIRTALVGGADLAWFKRTIAYENIVNWNEDFTDIVPNVAERYETSEDGTETTFYLRRGLKWSDGALYTADDIMFFYEDLILDENVTAPLSPWWSAGGEIVSVEKIDDYTVTFRFAAPNPLFVFALAHPDEVYLTHIPKHYLSQFHIRYNPEADRLAQAAGFDNWTAHLSAQILGNASYSDSARPVLWAWKLTTGYGESTSQLVAERNPYYFKADPDGNQLPYINSVRFDLVGNEEVLLLKTLSGEIDLMFRHINTNINKPVLFDNMERGNYRFIELVSTGPGPGMIAVNMTHKDPIKRELYLNKDFRIALSLAINRQEIIDAIFVGQGEPFQAALLPSSPFFDESFATQYTEYDPERANELLDSVGLAERDGEGFRLLPDGSRLQVFVNASAVGRQDWVDIMELVKVYWDAVGVETFLNTADRSLLAEMQNNNNHDATIWFAEGGGGLEPLIVPRLLIPNAVPQAFFGPGWAYWRANPNHELAVEPPENVKRAIDLYRQVTTTLDPEARDALMRELVAVAADNFYALGITSLPAEYGIVSQELRNVPDTMPSTYTWPTPAPSNLSIWFFER